MRKFINFLLIGALVVISPQLAWAKINAMIPEARPFEITLDGIDVVGLDLGPVNGKPALVVGGYTSSFPYLRKFVRALARQGYRVFLYNPPGQGTGLLESGREARGEHLGINGLLHTFSAMRSWVYQQTNRKKVTVIGHSLGGLQVRLGSMGLTGLLDGNTRVSRSEFERAKRETSLIVPMFSMGIVHEEAWEDATYMRRLLLADLVPLILDCAALVKCIIPGPLKDLYVSGVLKFLKRHQDNLYRGLIGAEELDHEEVDDLRHFLLPQRVSPQIRKDMKRFFEERVLTTEDGFDLDLNWKRQQTSKQAIPTYYFYGSEDSLTPKKWFEHERKVILNSKYFIAPTGHAGAYLDANLAEQMARLIAREDARLGCGRLLGESDK